MVETDTDDVPAITAENQAEEAAVIPVQSASVKRRLAAVKEKKTAQELADEAASSDDKDAVTALGKRGGELGLLDAEVTAGDEKLALRKYLYRRIDDLQLSKSDPAADADPGTPAGNQ
jgi:hypothetical protein